MAAGSVVDGTLAESQAQAAAIWRVREGVTESLQRRGGWGLYLGFESPCWDAGVWSCTASSSLAVSATA